jgi:eukaryotic-like serine/threonine-protein kinase
MTPDRWQQIERLYHAAQEREGEDRAVYLRQACGGDDALRKEVESLLAQGKTGEGFLDRSALGEVAAEMFDQQDSRSLLGRQLSSYRVLSLLGVGGMGEVYEARDTKLGRNVAIKVLPAAFVNDPERLSRFQREARMLAALNHPNIATIHGFEQSDGVHYLVMELVTGQTLAERLQAGPLRVEDTLKIAGQIAEALEAAHEKGVIHRDLKPANVKVAQEGRVKVLDFGLAKAFAAESATDLSQAPTLSEEGRILGTPAYMSPEQARGKPVDKRTDIWAFGCMLYQLLTGQRAFRGETVQDTIAAVLQREPDWGALPETTPLSIGALLRRCLQKDLNRRARDAGDIRIELEEALAAPTTGEPTTAAKGIRALGRRALVLSLCALLLGAAIATVAVRNLKPSPPPPPRPVSRFAVTLPPGQQLAGLDGGNAVALSPDGTHLAYVARQGGTQQLYLRAMNSLEAKPVSGTEGAFEPFFSPDGQWLGFFAGRNLKKVSVSGGAALTLGASRFPLGASWGSQGMIAFTPGFDPGGSVVQISDAGGMPQPLTRLEKGQGLHGWPEFLPGDKALLFAATTNANNRNWTNAQVAVQSVGTGQQRNLIQGGMQPSYAPSGHLVYAQGGSLMAVPFDPRRLAVTGTAVPVVDAVLQSAVTGAAQYSISTTGSLVYVPGGIQGSQSRPVWVSRNGAEQPLAATVHDYMFPRVSPDGRRLAVGIVEQESQVWLYDLSRETLTRLTFGGDVNTNPAWTPDGKRIAFRSNKEGPLNLFWQLADGSGGLERLTTSEYTNIPNSWSLDGQLLAFSENNPSTGLDIWILRLSDRKAEPFLRTPFNETAPHFSPDGHWLAYTSNESGRYEIYVLPYPGPGGKWQISTEGGTEPVWNPNGRELFYRSSDKMMAVDVATQPGFAAGKPRVLFEGPYQPTPITFPNYDVSPDGQRFLMLKPSEQEHAVPTQINVVLNWFEELKQKVPTGKK